jgi:hypothetical protein
MYARIVRFTDVSSDRIEAIKQRIAADDGPPPGVDSVGVTLYFDQSQGTAVFVGLFETEEKMQAAGEVLAAMDSGDTPGARASIDSCEVALEREA